jgi:hypothetical protein
MGTLSVVLAVLAVGAINSALLVWLARRTEGRIISAVQAAGASVTAVTQARCADLQASAEVIGAGIMSAVQLKSEYLHSAVDALRADVCSKASPGVDTPTVLIPEQHYLEIEMKAALAFYGINSVDLLNRMVADCRVLCDILTGRASAGLLVKVWLEMGAPSVAKKIFSDIAREVDEARAAAGDVVGALRADACTQLGSRLAAPGIPAVLIPEERCLEIEMKAALAFHKIQSVEQLNGTFADAQVIYDILDGRESVTKAVQVLCQTSSPVVAKQIFSELVQWVDSARLASVDAGGERVQ